MHLHKMHKLPPVWLIYLRPWRVFRKFHYDPHSSQCSRPDWGHSPLQSLSPLSVHMHKQTECETASLIHCSCQSLFLILARDIHLLSDTHTDKLNWEIPKETSSKFLNQSGGPKLINQTTGHNLSTYFSLPY